jgi:hypothetical protein
MGVTIFSLGCKWSGFRNSLFFDEKIKKRAQTNCSILNAVCKHTKKVVQAFKSYYFRAKIIP